MALIFPKRSMRREKLSEAFSRSKMCLGLARPWPKANGRTTGGLDQVRTRLSMSIPTYLDYVRCNAQSHWNIPAFGYVNNEDHRLVEPCGRSPHGETEPSHSCCGGRGVPGLFEEQCGWVPPLAPCRSHDISKRSNDVCCLCLSVRP